MSSSATPNGVWIVMQKELQLLFKSRRRIFLLFMIPLMIIIIAAFSAATTSFAVDDETEMLSISVINDSPGEYSNGLITLWETINDTEYKTIDAEFSELAESGNFNILVYIPSNFTDLLEQELTASLAIMYNTNSSRNSIVASQITQLTAIYESLLIQSSNPDVNFDLITTQFDSFRGDDAGIPAELAELIIIIPVYIIVFVVIPPISLIMISVTIEREQRTLEVLFLQPVTRRSIVLGKIMYGLGLVLITAVLDLIAAVISYFLFIGIANIDTGGDVDVGGLVQQGVADIGPLPFIGFFLSIIVIAFVVISLAVLLSLLAKDEREANMITGLIPLLLFIVIAVVFVVPIDELNFAGQLIWSILPVMGVIIAIYLSALAGEVIVIGWISIAAQLAWSLIIVLITARISEAESIIELTWGKAIRELFRSIFRR